LCFSNNHFCVLCLCCSAVLITNFCVHASNWLNVPGRNPHYQYRQIWQYAQNLVWRTKGISQFQGLSLERRSLMRCWSFTCMNQTLMIN
jgi:hypothetical protein